MHQTIFKINFRKYTLKYIILLL